MFGTALLCVDLAVLKLNSQTKLTFETQREICPPLPPTWATTSRLRVFNSFLKILFYPVLPNTPALTVEVPHPYVRQASSSLTFLNCLAILWSAFLYPTPSPPCLCPSPQAFQPTALITRSSLRVLLSLLLLWQSTGKKQHRRRKDRFVLCFQAAAHHWGNSRQEPKHLVTHHSSNREKRMWKVDRKYCGNVNVLNITGKLCPWVLS